MPAAVTRPPPAAAGTQATRPDRSRMIGVPIIVAVVVRLLAEVAVRVGKSSLATPSARTATSC
ncbi:MAG: hypothetical protein QOJ52_211 [Acidimicrobiaceae bacterium]|nr:hypothetical protein [Acidimicrobiaceae bacterium]